MEKDADSSSVCGGEEASYVKTELFKQKTRSVSPIIVHWDMNLFCQVISSCKGQMVGSNRIHIPVNLQMNVFTIQEVT